jgi:hypothetical protein
VIVNDEKVKREENFGIITRVHAGFVAKMIDEMPPENRAKARVAVFRRRISR